MFPTDSDNRQPKELITKKLQRLFQLHFFTIQNTQLLTFGREIEGTRSDRVPEELWMEVHDIVQKAGIKTIPKKRNAKRQSGCLRRPYKQLRKDAKGKGEKERYTHLNAEFQRIMRNKKAFLSLQCKETEENNRTEKTRYLFKKIRDTKGIFHAKWAQ